MNLDVNGRGEGAGKGRVAGGREVMGGSHCTPSALLWKFIFIK